jgi:hypothetical protein
MESAAASPLLHSHERRHEWHVSSFAPALENQEDELLLWRHCVARLVLVQVLDHSFNYHEFAFLWVGRTAQLAIAFCWVGHVIAMAENLVEQVPGHRRTVVGVVGYAEACAQHLFDLRSSLWITLAHQVVVGLAYGSHPSHSRIALRAILPPEEAKDDPGRCRSPCITRTSPFGVCSRLLEDKLSRHLAQHFGLPELHFRN